MYLSPDFLQKYGPGFSQKLEKFIQEQLGQGEADTAEDLLSGLHDQTIEALTYCEPMKALAIKITSAGDLQPFEVEELARAAFLGLLINAA